MHADAVEIGDITVYREVDQPGWRWSTHHRDMVGTEWCEARHVGVVISGRFGVLLRDGTQTRSGPMMSSRSPRDTTLGRSATNLP